MGSVENGGNYRNQKESSGHSSNSTFNWDKEAIRPGVGKILRKDEILRLLGGKNGPQSFEELLERALQQQGVQADQSGTTATVNKPVSFLKKGSKTPIKLKKEVSEPPLSTTSDGTQTGDKHKINIYSQRKEEEARALQEFEMLEQELYEEPQEKEIIEEINDKQNILEEKNTDTRVLTYDHGDSPTFTRIQQEKLRLLEEEIASFKLQNDRISQIRIEREQQLMYLKQEVEQINARKSQEAQLIEKIREETTRKLTEKFQAANKEQMKQYVDKIEQLQNLLNRIQEEHKQEKQDLKLTIDKLKKRTEELQANKGEEKTEQKPKQTNLINLASSEARIPSQRPQPSNQRNGSNEFNDPIFMQLQKELQQLLNGSTISMSNNERVSREIEHSDGKIETLFTSGKRMITFKNGTKKEILPNGMSSVFFINGDIKKTYVDGKVIYWYAEVKTMVVQFV